MLLRVFAGVFHSMTAFGARRSELPSRSTGLTALPMQRLAGANFLFFVVFGASGKFRDLVALALQLLDGGLGWGTDALMLGSLMMLTFRPRSAAKIGQRVREALLGRQVVRNSPRMRAATRMSAVSTLIPAGAR